jgi:hypothetical protein
VRGRPSLQEPNVSVQGGLQQDQRSISVPLDDAVPSPPSSHSNPLFKASPAPTRFNSLGSDGSMAPHPPPPRKPSLESLTPGTSSGNGNVATAGGKAGESGQRVSGGRMSVMRQSGGGAGSGPAATRSPRASLHLPPAQKLSDTHAAAAGSVRTSTQQQTAQLGKAQSQGTDAGSLNLTNRVDLPQPIGRTSSDPVPLQPPEPAGSQSSPLAKLRARVSNTREHSAGPPGTTAGMCYLVEWSEVWAGGNQAL